MDALGADQADAFMAVLASPDDLAITVRDPDAEGVYPYRHPALDPILDAVPVRGLLTRGTTLGAALTLLAARPNSEHHTAPAAYAVLRRAARAGDCAAQLNLLLLLAADINTTASVLGQEQDRAKDWCPDDPTPDWLVGQTQLRRTPVAPAESEDVVRSTQTSPGIETMQSLVERNPEDVVALTGLGDAYLSAAMELDEKQPFSARGFFRRALNAYNDAVEHGGRREAAPGLARSLLALGRPERAAELLEPLVQDSASPGQLLELLIAAHESAREFNKATTAAQRLSELGPDAYPTGNVMLPVPQGSYSPGTTDDMFLALSLGADRFAPLNEHVVENPEGGGADVLDIPFIPPFHPTDGVTGTFAACPDWAWRRNAVLAGDPARALENWPSRFEGVRPDRSKSGCVIVSADVLRSVAERASGRATITPGLTVDEVADAHQNLFRWSGDLDGARRIAQEWASLRPDSALAHRRLAEIDYLNEKYDEAAAGFDLAAHHARLADWGDDLTVAQMELARGAALAAGGREEAESTLRPLVHQGTAGFAYQQGQNYRTALEFAAVSYYACLQLGDLERRSDRLHAAAEDYEKALSWLPTFTDRDIKVDRPEVLHNNAALANLTLGALDRAEELATRALEADPESPLFLMTSAFVAERQGDDALAAQRNRDALRSDPSAYPAANDLGVELARLGEDEAARRAFRQSVAARPDYALGWFNLGVLESSLGPGRLLQAQNALGKAYALDPDLRDRRRELTIDASVYRTALDLSKPLPPAWSFAGVERRATVASAGLLATLALGLGLARATGRRGSELAEEWLDPLSQRLESMPVLRRLGHPGWAVAATAVTFLAAAVRRPVGWTELSAYIVGLLALTAATICLREAVARRSRAAVKQSTWLPGVGFGLVTGAVGYPWAPLPVVAARPETPRVHLAASVLLACIALLLFVESAWLAMPLTSAWAATALTMAASLLLPVGPLDGAHAGKAGIAAGAGVVVTALLVGLGLL
ncbi:tetratricopeptide repeat protein [Geodermatophilus maliterrae]|uniref:Tetratricopeptide repeat-containing protein n=1 Tax=Geodermatophilus maliterrae TaxID=3162531 RepID=A0ABV3XCC7_9ACTN